MRVLSPQTRQKLAILLKSKESANSGVLPPDSSGTFTNPVVPKEAIPQIKMPQVSQPMAPANPAPLNAMKMTKPDKFAALKEKVKKF